MGSLLCPAVTWVKAEHGPAPGSRWLEVIAHPGGAHGRCPFKPEPPGSSPKSWTSCARELPFPERRCRSTTRCWRPWAGPEVLPARPGPECSRTGRGDATPSEWDWRCSLRPGPEPSRTSGGGGGVGQRPQGGTGGAPAAAGPRMFRAGRGGCHALQGWEWRRCSCGRAQNVQNRARGGGGGSKARPVAVPGPRMFQNRGVGGEGLGTTPSGLLASEQERQRLRPHQVLRRTVL